MSNIFLKDEPIDKSPAIVGFKIARYMQDKGTKFVSIFDVIDHFKQEKWFAWNTFFYGLTFLYSVGYVDFEEPYLIDRNDY